MKGPGGYQMVDFNNIEITNGSATTVTDPKNSTILRESNKVIYIYNIVVDGVKTYAVADIKTDTGARDGKVYGFIGPNSAFFNISTDDDKITFTPA